ncbi:MAG: SMI1/KNR4 family protein [Clostridium sp.]
MISKFGNASELEIELLEKNCNINLPSEYKEFLFSYNGGVVDKKEENKIYIEDLDEYINIDVLYGIKTESRTSDIITWMNKLGDDLIEGSIIIGDDLLQGMIVMITEGDFKGIYYWDDSYNFDSSSDDENTYLIFNDFKELLDKIEG